MSPFLLAKYILFPKCVPKNIFVIGLPKSILSLDGCSYYPPVPARPGVFISTSLNTSLVAISCLPEDFCDVPINFASASKKMPLIWKRTLLVSNRFSASSFSNVAIFSSACLNIA